MAVRLDSPRTAGVDPAQILLAATAADVDTVVVDGRLVVSGGSHRLGDVGRLLGAAIEPLWASMSEPRRSAGVDHLAQDELDDSDVPFW